MSQNNGTKWLQCRLGLGILCTAQLCDGVWVW